MTTTAEENVRAVEEFGRRFNSGNYEAVLEMLTEDASLLPADEWPDPPPPPGREAVGAFMWDFLSAWEKIQLRYDSLEPHGDEVVARGAWETTGDSSGAGGEIPFGLTLGVREGRISRLRWFMQPADAVPSEG